MSAERCVSIYKLDTNHGFFDNCGNTFEEKIQHLINKGNEKIKESIQKNNDKRETSIYSSISVKDFDIKNFTIKAFHSRRSAPNEWNDFLKEISNENEKYFNENHDFIVFIHNDEDLFCITGGGAFRLIDSVADEEFPRQLIARLADPEGIKQAKSRGLTGSFYARDFYYRGKNAISASEAFGSIWKNIRIALREDVKNDSGWCALFGEKTKRDIYCDAGASFEVRKKIGFKAVLRLIEKIQTTCKKPLTLDEELSFAFLNSVKLLGEERSKGLNEELIEKARKYLLGQKGAEFDYDFCHKEYALFHEARDYKAFKKRKELTSWINIKDAKQVIEDLNEHGGFSNLKDKDIFKQEFESAIRIKTEAVSGGSPLNGSLLDHIHGELVIEDGVCFLIDGKWYELNDNFLQSLRDDFNLLINNLIKSGCFFETPTSFLSDWTNEDEGPYNELYVGMPGFLVADRIFLDHLELFDLLYIENNNLYIIQVKDGLGATTRDACSQIRNSARVIEASVKSRDKSKLKEFYKILLDRHGGIKRPDYAKEDKYIKSVRDIAGSEKDFLELFKKKRHYVLAFRKNGKKENVINTKSSIAKFEIIGLKDYLKLHDVEFDLYKITGKGGSESKNDNKSKKVSRKSK